MIYGVVIEHGPHNWQILQQEQGSAVISLSGWFHRPDSIPSDEGVKVYGRVVEEDTGSPVVPWTGAQTEDDRFSLQLCVPAGGLYRIETCMPREGNQWNFDWAVRGDIRHHVGVGDLYVIAGQSNAKGFGREPAYDPPQLGVHMMRHNGQWDLATQPLGDSTDIQWMPALDRSVTGYSPYLAFAKQVNRTLGYPIGLIQTSKGGSKLEEWHPETGELYRGMVQFIQKAGNRIKGVLWYQGCSDANDDCSIDYLQRFESMVSALRKTLGETVPFLTCQLNRVRDSKEDVNWTRIRQAQLDAARTLEQVYVLPTIDLSLSDGIHNDSFSVLRLGERLANAALAWIYHRGNFPVPYPVSAHKVGDNSISLHFSGIMGDETALSVRSQKAENLPITVFGDGKAVRIHRFLPDGDNTILLETEPLLFSDIQVTVLFGADPSGVPIFDKNSKVPVLAGNVIVEMEYGRGE